MHNNILNFFIVGINYRKTDAAVRGLFAINNEQYASILKRASILNLEEIFVVSTCNRTEIYGVVESAETLIDLLCGETEGTKEIMLERSYAKQGMHAVEHLFNVAAGLDSQILGDYEIVGQMKMAVKVAKEHHMIGAFTERLFNTVLQSSKAIKTNTELSSGTVSVSFAAIQFLKEHVANVQNKKIVLLGTGKIGRNTCKNLVDYLETKDITLINRSEDKAKELAESLNLKYAAVNNLHDEIKQADIVIVATNAPQAIITPQHIATNKNQVLVDLSIPNNILPSCKELNNILLVNVDDLSKINDITLQKRVAEVPKAKKIIQEHIDEFLDWNCLRKNVPVLKAVKQKLMAINESNSLSSYTTISTLCDAELQKLVNNMAVKMKQQHLPGCFYIEAINDYITTAAN
jgi:glutamyl-tRNA reductase